MIVRTRIPTTKDHKNQIQNSSNSTMLTLIAGVPFPAEIGILLHELISINEKVSLPGNRKV